MTDETIEQIEKDATEYMVEEYGQSTGFQEADTIRDNGKFDFSQGATHQHPISHAQGVKEGRRQAIEECINSLKVLPNPFISHIKELEALKTEIKK